MTYRIIYGRSFSTKKEADREASKLVRANHTLVKQGQSLSWIIELDICSDLQKANAVVHDYKLLGITAFIQKQKS